MIVLCPYLYAAFTLIAKLHRGRFHKTLYLKTTDGVLLHVKDTKGTLDGYVALVHYNTDLGIAQNWLLSFLKGGYEGRVVLTLPNNCPSEFVHTSYRKPGSGHHCSVWFWFVLPLEHLLSEKIC